MDFTLGVVAGFVGGIVCSVYAPRAWAAAQAKWAEFVERITRP